MDTIGLFERFLDCLLDATGNIQEKYFKLPVAHESYVYRERAYCYELYHQIRLLLPEEFPYTLSGEVNKVGHPDIVTFCGEIIPDFLVHNPGCMGDGDNLVIIEVKTIKGADFHDEDRGLLKDITTINCMTGLPNGYFKGIILIFGSDFNKKKRTIEEIYRERCDAEKVLLLYHENPMTKARIV